MDPNPKYANGEELQPISGICTKNNRVIRCQNGKLILNDMIISDERLDKALQEIIDERI